MNPLSKLLAPATRAFNAAVDGMNSRSLDMIRQTYVFLIVILCIVGAVIGFTTGKKSAKKAGTQMAETTNEVFDIDIQQARKQGSFDSVLDNELESGLDMKDAPKSGLPARERLAAEDTVRISEPEKDRHIKTGPEISERADLAQPPRMDDKPVINDTKALNRSVEKAPADISDKKISPLIEEAKPSGDIRDSKPQKAVPKEKRKLKPLEKKGGLAE